MENGTGDLAARAWLVRAAALLAALLAAPAGATILYKSIGPRGVIEFSDTPPGPESKIVEQREIRPPTPVEEHSIALTDAESALVSDDAVAEAAAQLDLAEHALALARRSLWSPRDGLRLSATRMTPADEDRVRFYEKKVNSARRALIALLQQRQRQQVVASR